MASTEMSRSMAMNNYRYTWPEQPLERSSGWTALDERYWQRSMPEQRDDLSRDSAWPAFFPSAVALITTRWGGETYVEREVGASIVNRFPYIVAISLCREPISARHHPRSKFMRALESNGSAAIQFLEPGPELDAALTSIHDIPDEHAAKRVADCGLQVRSGFAVDTDVLSSAYLSYEATLVKPQRDFEGVAIYQEPWMDVGSHRIYFFEIKAIGLRADIADGQKQIRWRSVPVWTPVFIGDGRSVVDSAAGPGYRKGYTPRYAFPSSQTAAFERDRVIDGTAVKFLPPLPEDQVEVDNDRARWPCFFPSSAGLITSWADDGTPNLMPCGSTTVVSRHPFVIAPCVSYAQINVRYARRRSLDFLSSSGRFGCSVPFISDAIIEAMKYAGNISHAQDRDKVRNSGLSLGPASDYGPVLAESPIHFDCEVVDEVRLGTHIMYLGEVRRILVRRDVSPDNPVEWFPLAAVTDADTPPPV